MPTIELLLVATLGVPAAPVMFVAPAAEQPDLSEAERLFNEGQARYDAADYDGAIEIFTLTLSEVRDQGVVDFRVLGPLLFNIGRAHTRAYEIDRKIEHLRQAKAIFSRFIEGGESFPDEVDAEDLAEARTQLDELGKQLDELEAEEDTPVEPMPTPATGEAGHERQATRARRAGAGLTASGIALIGGGIGMLVWGLGYGPAAEAKVAELDALGLPADHPVFDEGADYIAAERRKGTAWIAAGSIGAAVGLTALAVGVSQLVKAKRLSSSDAGVAATLTPSAAIGPASVVVGVHGRF